MGRIPYTCNNCEVEPCAIRTALRTEPFGDIIGTHGVKCKFHKYKPKTVAKPEVEKAPVVDEQPAPTE